MMGRSPSLRRPGRICWRSCSSPSSRTVYSVPTRWFLLLLGVGSRQTFLEVVRLVFVSSFLGYFSSGGLGVDAVRIFGFARASSDMGLAVTSVIVDRALGMLALLLLVLMALMRDPIECHPRSLTWPGWAWDCCSGRLPR